MTETLTQEGIEVAKRYKLKEMVREQHRKVIRKQHIAIVVWIAALNFGIIWIVVHSDFDERVISATSNYSFFVGFVVFPNIVTSLIPLLWMNSNDYRAKIPNKIKEGVTKMYEQNAGDESDDQWGGNLTVEIDNLAW